MNENKEYVLNLGKLFFVLCKRLPLILLSAVLVGVLGFFLTKTPEETFYLAKARFFAPTEASVSDNRSKSDDGQFPSESTVSVVLSSLDSYCYIATSPTTLETVVSQAALPCSVSELSQIVSTSKENAEAKVFSVQVRCSDEQEALQIAKAFSSVLPDVFDEISPGIPFRVLDSASVSEYTVGGNDIKKSVLLACLAAFAAACVIAAKYVIDDITGKGFVVSSDLKDFAPEAKLLALFSGADDGAALKRLRSSIQLAFDEGSGCRTIGITGAHTDLFKNELCSRLSESFAELGDRVLLIDADLRSHPLRDQACAESGENLSDILRNQKKSGSVKETAEKRSYSLLPAGDGASEASELLDKKKLVPVLQRLREEYDLILLNLESMGSSIDAASVGTMLDGVIVTFRERVCSRNQLAACLSDLTYAKANLIGFASVKEK